MYSMRHCSEDYDVGVAYTGNKQAVALIFAMQLRVI